MLVSVFMITYNQEKFISQAIESVLIQRTNYEYKIYIGDDCSTDQTRDICISYKKKNPDKIELFLNEKNDIKQNVKSVFDACFNSGAKYIAMLEGDDYWTDPCKLQKQVDFLEANPEFSISSHNVFVHHEDNSEPDVEWLSSEHQEIITLEDLLRTGSGGATCSLVFRNGVFGSFPAWYTELQGGDWTLQILCASHGKMRYFREPMGVYRRGHGGMTTVNPGSQKEIDIYLAGGVRICEVLDAHFDYRYHYLLNENLHKYFYPNLFSIYQRNGQSDIAKAYAQKIIMELVPRNELTPDNFISLLKAFEYRQQHEIEQFLLRLMEFSKKMHVNWEIFFKFIRKVKADTTVNNLIFIGPSLNGMAEQILKESGLKKLFCFETHREELNRFPELAKFTNRQLFVNPDKFEYIENFSFENANQVPWILIGSNDIASIHDIVFDSIMKCMAPMLTLCVVSDDLKSVPQLREQLEERFFISSDASTDEMMFLTFDMIHGGRRAVNEVQSEKGLKPNAEEGTVRCVQKPLDVALSFIIPCYNCEATIRQSVDSIYAQDLDFEFEVVCTDDYSTDGTLQVLKEYEKRYRNFRVISHNVNAGGAAARNTCVKNSSGEMIFCLDSDNVLESGSISKLIEYQRTSGCEAASFASLQYFSTDITNPLHRWTFTAKNNICDLNHIISEIQTPAASGNYLYARKSWTKAGGYPEGRGAMDAWGFGFRQHATGTLIAIMPDSFYWHRLSDNSYWVRENRENKNDLNAVTIVREKISLFDFPTQMLLRTAEAASTFFKLIEQKRLHLKQTVSLLSPSDGTALKLHIGCGPRILKGWVNIDLFFEPFENYLKYYTDEHYGPEVRGSKDDFIPLNVAKERLPFDDGTVDVIFNEDFIEHIDQREQILFLAETFRVLKPGGVHRVTTPNLRWFMDNKCNFVEGRTGVNIDCWEWGHKNLLTAETLKALAAIVGFDIVIQERGKSLAKNLPKEYRPDPKDGAGNDATLFVDLIKPIHGTSHQQQKLLSLVNGQKGRFPVKLHLGCGEQYLEGYINIDYPPSEHTVQVNTKADVYADITALAFEDRSVEEVRLHHVFEHFDRVKALAQLIRWYKWLSPNGTVVIETPDIDASLRLLRDDKVFYADKQAVLRHIFGSQEAHWAVHYDGWNKQKYKHVLRLLGFSHLEFEYNQWKQTRNILVRARKVGELKREQLLANAKEILRDSLIDESPAELRMLEVWYAELEKYCAHRGAARRLTNVLTDEIASEYKQEDLDLVETKHAAVKYQLMLAVIFSKDRPLQLDATLRSFMLHCQDFHRVSIRIIFRTSNENYRESYQVLEQEYSSYSNILFILENDFRQQVLHLLKSDEYVIWLVDDNIFVRNFKVADFKQLLENNKDALGYSLRLGENTTYFYMLDKPQPLPIFAQLTPDTLKYDWTSAKYDFGYPLEVSSSIYRTTDMLRLLTPLPFYNPNSLEEEMARQVSRFQKSHPYLLCSKTSVTFCNPINTVQNTIPQNRAGESYELNAESLLVDYLKGQRIDAAAFDGFTSDSCHQEVALTFVNSMNDCPKISVIIPCYNYAHYLPEAVESVLNQTFKDFEIVIVNDGSTDNTSSVSRELIRKFRGNRIQFIEKENGGVADARNYGIRLARGEWVMPLDSDDMLAPTFFEKAMAFIENDLSVDIVFANLQQFGTNSGRWVPSEYSDELILKENTIPYAAIYRKKLWEDVGGYSRVLGKVMQLEDWEFWIRVSRLHPHVVRIPEPLFLYRVHGSNIYYLMIQRNMDLVRSFNITANPEIYTNQQIHNACILISKCPSEICARVLATAERYPDESLPYFWLSLICQLNSHTATAAKLLETSIHVAKKEGLKATARINILELISKII